jgi:hypothetical protein
MSTNYFADKLFGAHNLVNVAAQESSPYGLGRLSRNEQGTDAAKIWLK